MVTSREQLGCYIFRLGVECCLVTTVYTVDKCTSGGARTGPELCRIPGPTRVPQCKLLVYWSGGGAHTQQLPLNAAAGHFADHGDWYTCWSNPITAACLCCTGQV